MSVLKNSQSIKQTDFYNEIVIKYAYDYSAADFSKTYVYPEQDSLNESYLLLGRKRSLEVKLPFVYTKALAQAWAERYYQMWSFGVAIQSHSSTFDAYSDTFFSYESRRFIVTKCILNYGSSFNVYIEGFNLDTDHNEYWGW